MQVRGATFVVTGGGNGIGREVVLTLLTRGARVAAVDLRDEGLAETARLAGVLTERLRTYAVDVTDRAAVEALPARVEADLGPADGLVNVAGIIQPFVPLADLDVATIEKVMAVNFWGVVYTVKAFLPGLLTRPAGAIVNVSSMGAFVPVPGQSAYGASKAAVMLLTEGLYAELRGSRVAVTVVYPGGVATNITGNSGVAMPGMPGGAGAGSAGSASSGASGAASAEESAMAMTTPADAAAQIVAGIEKGAFRVVIGKDAKTLDLLSRLSPRRATELVAKKMAALLR